MQESRNVSLYHLPCFHVHHALLECATAVAGLLPSEIRKCLSINGWASILFALVINLKPWIQKLVVIAYMSSIPMNALLQAGLEKRVIRQRLYIFRLVLTAIKDWGETNSNTPSYSSCHALVSGRLSDSLDNVQMTLYPNVNTKQIWRSWHNRRFRSLIKLRHSLLKALQCIFAIAEKCHRSHWKPVKTW